MSGGWAVPGFACGVASLRLCSPLRDPLHAHEERRRGGDLAGVEQGATLAERHDVGGLEGPAA